MLFLNNSEVRNPFDLGYLYGISALRLFLPLYFYGCPNNFLTAFPMVRIIYKTVFIRRLTTDPQYCRIKTNRKNALVYFVVQHTV